MGRSNVRCIASQAGLMVQTNPLVDKCKGIPAYSHWLSDYNPAKGQPSKGLALHRRIASKYLVSFKFIAQSIAHEQADACLAEFLLLLVAHSNLAGVTKI